MARRPSRALRRDEEIEGVLPADVMELGSALRGCSKAGWLDKLGEQSIVKRWQPRFVVLSGALLYYFVDGDHKRKPRGVINLEGSILRPSTRASEDERTLVSMSVASKPEEDTSSSVWSALDGEVAAASAATGTTPSSTPPLTDGLPAPKDSSISSADVAGLTSGEASPAPPPMVCRAFEIETRNGRRFHFRCELVSDAIAWVTAMRAACSISIHLPGWAGVSVNVGDELRAAMSSTVDAAGMAALRAAEDADLAEALKASQSDEAITPSLPSDTSVPKASISTEPEDVGSLPVDDEAQQQALLTRLLEAQQQRALVPTGHIPVTIAEAPAARSISTDRDIVGLDDEARRALLAAPPALQTAWAIMESRALANTTTPELSSSSLSRPPPHRSEPATPEPKVPIPTVQRSRADSYAVLPSQAQSDLIASLRAELSAMRKSRREHQARAASLRAELDVVKEECEDEATAREEAEVRMQTIEGKLRKAIISSRSKPPKAEIESAVTAALEEAARSAKAKLSEAVARAEAACEARAEALFRAHTNTINASAQSRGAVDASVRASLVDVCAQAIQERDRLWQTAARRSLARLREKMITSVEGDVDGSELAVSYGGAGSELLDVGSSPEASQGPSPRRKLHGVYLETLQWMVAQLPTPDASLRSPSAKGVAAAAVQGAHTAMAVASAMEQSSVSGSRRASGSDALIAAASRRATTGTPASDTGVIPARQGDGPWLESHALVTGSAVSESGGVGYAGMTSPLQPGTSHVLEPSGPPELPPRDE